jgi:hypothetical protein
MRWRHISGSRNRPDKLEVIIGTRRNEMATLIEKAIISR